MKWEHLCKDIKLSLDGLGMVFYSEGAVQQIPIGEDYFKKEFLDPQKVAEHIRCGDMIAICTEGESYEFELRFRSGCPSDEIQQNYPAQLQFAIHVMGTEINVVDVYWLMQWKNDCPKKQQVELEPGIYQMKVCGEPPLRALEEQLSEEECEEYANRPRVVYIFLDRLEEMPEQHWNNGVPDLYWAYDEE